MNKEINKLSPLSSDTIASYLDKDGSILEIGCGKGETLRCLIDSGFKVIGVDKAASLDSKSKLPIVSASAENLPFAPESFDSVLMECVFSLCNPEQTVAEISRVIKPGGKVVLSDLYVVDACVTVETSNLIRNLFTKERLSGYFEDYTLELFEDISADLTDFAAQLLFSSSSECCEDIKTLIRYKPKYGIWIYRKNRL